MQVDKSLKIVLAPFALRTETSLERIGTFSDLLNAVLQFEAAGVRHFAELPINQMFRGMASPFSCSAFGLNTDYIALDKIAEVKTDRSLKQWIQPLDLDDKDRMIDFIGVRVAKKQILVRAAEHFSAMIAEKPHTRRARSYAKFCRENATWLGYNARFEIVQTEMLNLGLPADFRVWPEAYRTPDTPEVMRLVELNEACLDIYRYMQFVAHEQLLAVSKELRKRDILMEVNLPYGVSTDASGDVWALQGEVFDMDWEVGCYLEPRNGYDEQRWGLPQYKSGKAFDKFLLQRYTYLAQYVDRIFIDHLCGFANKYYFPAREIQGGTLDGSVPVKGHFEIPLYPTDMAYRKNHPEYSHLDPFTHGEEIMTLMSDKVYTMLKTILDAGLQVGGETLGDDYRQAAVEQALQRLNKEGYHVPEMAVSINKNRNGIFPDPQAFPHATEWFLATHDMPTILQILCNQRGKEKLWYLNTFPHILANFLSQVFGILTTPNKIPLRPEEVTRELGRILLERFCTASAGSVVIPLQDLFCLMYPAEIGVNMDVNLNLPGEAAEIGNPWGNFSRRFPQIEKLTQDAEVTALLHKLAQRASTAFIPVERLIEHAIPMALFTFVAGTAQREVVYRDRELGCWTVLSPPDGQQPILEMVIGNVTDEKVIGAVELPDVYKPSLEPDADYLLDDLEDASGVKMERSGHDLLHRIYIELGPRRDHHFLVYLKKKSKKKLSGAVK